MNKTGCKEPIINTFWRRHSCSCYNNFTITKLWNVRVIMLGVVPSDRTNSHISIWNSQQRASLTKQSDRELSKQIRPTISKLLQSCYCLNQTFAHLFRCCSRQIWYDWWDLKASLTLNDKDKIPGGNRVDFHELLSRRISKPITGRKFTSKFLKIQIKGGAFHILLSI